MRALLPTLLLLGCPGGEDKSDTADAAAAPCVSDPMPLLATDVQEVDFGELPMGLTLVEVVGVRNDGDAPLSVSAIELGEGLVDFGVDYDLEDTPCASEATVDGAAVIVLEPGCELPVHVTYTPATSGGAADALVIESDGADPGGAFGPDPLHAYRVVWLQGVTEGELESASYVAGGVISLEQTAMYEGETIGVELRTFGSERPTVTWATDDPGWPAFDDPTAPLVSYLAPDVAAPGQNENLYVVVADSEGTEWGFGRVAVWDTSVPLYACE